MKKTQVRSDGPVECGECAYFEVFRKNVDGECRRHAPRPVCRPAENDDPSPYAICPLVDIEHWCGEFVRRVE
jgi:hypothetical protein